MIIASFRRNLSSLCQRGAKPRVQMNSLEPPDAGPSGARTCPGVQGAPVTCQGELLRVPRNEPSEIHKTQLPHLNSPGANRGARDERGRADPGGDPAAGPGTAEDRALAQDGNGSWQLPALPGAVSPGCQSCGASEPPSPVRPPPSSFRLRTVGRGRRD